MTTGNLVALLQDAYPGRTDCYLHEKKRCVYEPLTVPVLEAHLRGEARIGIYPNGAPWGITWDFDGKNLSGGADEAWRQLHDVNRVLDADLSLPCFVAEVSRSESGYHLVGFYDPDDPPSMDEHRRFGRLVLRAAGLPDDEHENEGHPGIYPHPPGPKGVGKTAFLPWSGLVNGSTIPTTCLFVNLSDRTPVDRQETVLEDARRIPRQQVLQAIEVLEGMMAEPAPEDSATKVDIDLTDPGPKKRHEALLHEAGRLRHLLPREETAAILEALAERWGLLAEGRGREVADAVEYVYSRPAKFVRTQFDREKRTGPRVELVPSSLLEVLDPNAGQVEHLVDGLVPKGEVSIYGAGWKVGKTLLMYHLGLAFGFGLPVFGEFGISEPGPVVIFQLEMPAREDARRFRRLAIGLGIEPAEVVEAVKDGRLTVYNRPTLLLSQPGDVAAFHDAIRKRDARIVIVDSVVAAFAGSKIDDNSEVRRLFSEAFHPLTDEGRSPLLLHHRRKMQGRQEDDQRNALLSAQAWGASAGAVYGLDRVKGDKGLGADREFEVKLSRTGAWTPDWGGDRLIRVRDTDDGQGIILESEMAENKAEEIVLAALVPAMDQGVLRSDLRKAIAAAGIPEDDKATTRALGKLHREGRVRKRGNTRAMRYWVAGAAPMDAE